MLADEFLAPHAVARWATERPDAIAVERQNPANVRQGHGPAGAALVRIERNDPAKRGRVWRARHVDYRHAAALI